MLQIIKILLLALPLAKSQSSSEEGNHTISAEVYGGTPARQGEIPYQVYLYAESLSNPSQGWVCGGTIYDEYNIVTAAHCIYEQNGARIGPERFHIYAGSTLRGQGVEVRASWIMTYPGYDPRGSLHDLAVIRLNQPLPIGWSIKSLRMAPSGAELNNGGYCLISGWGSTSRRGDPVSEDLLKANLRIDSYQNCAKYYNSDQLNTRTMICAGGNFANSCAGDSGGPLACSYSGGGTILAGVVSRGPNDCSISNYPSTFTKISYYSNWITQVATSLRN